MGDINIRMLLRKYKGWVRKGKIKFLQENDKARNEILNNLEELQEDYRRAEAKAKRKKESVSENLDWHKIHATGRNLWHNLASCALNDLDPEAKGNSRLFDFLTAATEFEDLLYGLDPYYRDHTLHSLWVYFIGEYILKELLVDDINKNLNWYVYNDIEKDCKKYSYPDDLVECARDKERYLIGEVKKHKDAIWCIIALAHDLGYSLSKLKRLNKKVENVLKFFDVPDFRHVGYSLDIEHQYHFSQFLELMAMDVRIIPSEDYKKLEILKEKVSKKQLTKAEYKKRIEEKTLIKCYRDDSTYWRLCRAIEKKQHGILSSYLIYKILDIFAEVSALGSAEEWGLEDEEAKENIIRGDILFAIAQHEFDFAHLWELNSLADILILADELEEFSRYGRQLLSRKYHDTTAEAGISFSLSKTKLRQYIDIEITYHAKHQDQEDFYEFFNRKAERLCKIYSLEEDAAEERRNKENKRFRTIKSIKMTVNWRTERLKFELWRFVRRTKGYLPRPKFQCDLGEGKHRLRCSEDKLYVIVRGNEIPLKKWLGINEEKGLL